MPIQINTTDRMAQLLFEHTGVDDPTLIQLILDVVETDLAKTSYPDSFGHIIVDPDLTSGTCIEVTR